MKFNSGIKRILIGGLLSIVIVSVIGFSVVLGIFGAEETIPTRASNLTDSNQMDNRIEPTPTASPTTPVQVLLPIPAVQRVEIQLTQAPPAVQVPTVEPTPVQRIVTITGDAVNLRSGPDTNTLILRTVTAGTVFVFTDQNSTGDWYQVCCVDNTLAWVYASLAKLEEPTASSVESTPTITAPPVPVSIAPVLPTALNIALPDPVFTQETVANGERYHYAEQGFAITLPNGWQPLDLSTAGWQTAMNTLARDNPGAAALVQTQLKSYVNARFSFFAADLTPNQLTQGYVTTVHLWKQPLPTGISLELYAQLTARQSQTKFALTTPISLTPLSLPAGQGVLLTYALHGGTQSTNQPLTVTQYLLMQAQTVYAFTFTTTTAQAADYAATFPAIMESFQLLEQ